MQGATGHHAGDGESTGMKFPGGACLAEVKTKEAFSPGGGVGGPKATSWGSPSAHPIMLGPFLKLRVLWRPFHSKNEP